MITIITMTWFDKEYLIWRCNKVCFHFANIFLTLNIFMVFFSFISQTLFKYTFASLQVTNHGSGQGLTLGWGRYEHFLIFSFYYLNFSISSSTFLHFFSYWSSGSERPSLRLCDYSVLYYLYQKFPNRLPSHSPPPS